MDRWVGACVDGWVYGWIGGWAGMCCSSVHIRPTNFLIIQSLFNLILAQYCVDTYVHMYVADISSSLRPLSQTIILCTTTDCLRHT